MPKLLLALLAAPIYSAPNPGPSGANPSFAMNTIARGRHGAPCGIAGVEMTSLEREGAGGVTVEGVAAKAAERFAAFLAE